MSDEAVVRVVLVDSTSGASRSATQSSTSGYSTPNQDPIRPDRLYRELVNVSSNINKGFKDSLVPVLRTLGEIRDILDRDYDYSEKDYRESTTQTSLLRMIGASLSGSTGAVGREITKGIGLSTADMQMVNVLNNINANIRDLKVSLSPETKKENISLLGRIIFGGAIGYGLTKLPDLMRLLSSPKQAAIAGAETAGEVAHAAGATPAEISEAATAASNAPSMIDQVVRDSMASLGSTLSDILPHLMTPGVIAPLIGLAAGGLMYLIARDKPTKELSVNELLQKLIDVVKDQTNYLGQGTREQIRYIQSIVLNTGVIDSRVEQIVAIMQQQIPTASIADETTAPGYGSHALNQTPPIDTLAEVGKEVQSTLSELEESGVPDTAIPQAIPVTELNESPVPDTKPPDNPWRGYRPKYHPGHPLSSAQRNELSAYGLGNKFNLSEAEFAKFLYDLEEAGSPPPEYLAKGGVVGNHPGSPRGTDTVPAWLTPGETIIPRYMAGGGVVGYGLGALLSGNAQMLGSMASASTDPSDRIGKFGDLISSTSGVLGKVNPMLGAFAEGLGAGVKGIALMVSAINESADKYGEYSPAIAQAQAMVEIRQTMGDMRRAQEISGDMARFVVAQGELQQKFEEAKIKLLVQIVPAINSILESISNVMGSGDGIRDAILVLTAPLTLVANTLELIRGIQQDDRLKEPEDPAELLLRNRNFDSLDDRVRGSWVPDR